MTARVWQKIDKEIIEILPSHAEISQLQGKTIPCVSKIIQKSLFSILYSLKVNWSTIEIYSQITEFTQLCSSEQVLHIKSSLLLQSLYPIWYVKCTLKPLFI